MHNNQIYDLDKKLYFSDYSSANLPPTAPLSMSTVPSNAGANMMPITGDTNMGFSNLPPQRDNMPNDSNVKDVRYSSKLVILEQPTEKFRFRYKSEMHGTHGSLYGDRSQKNRKTFPEVELRNFEGAAVIRCSLYQTNLDKPSLHSHQLVVHKDDMDVCDPHDVYVSPKQGYIARFENMGIIHTAKKDIAKELLNKKRQQLKFELKTHELSQKQEKTLRDEAEREAKMMNLNQVRLCFQAFKIFNGDHWVQICEPVFSRIINNRKSALTGELKICRLSIIAGTAAGGDDLILLVEKVNKNNIKVRFYEKINDEEVWEAYGYFTEADVHHQYAIVVRTPPYKNKDIDTHVNVFIELVRESDNERSSAVTFRYKPRDIILSRKRRRTSNSSVSTTSPLNSYELPESVAKSMPQTTELLKCEPQTISQEFNKEFELRAFDSEYQCLLNSFMHEVCNDSGELLKNAIGDPPLLESSFGLLELGFEIDGEGPINKKIERTLTRRSMRNSLQYVPTIKLLISAYNNCSRLGLEKTIGKVTTILEDYAAKNINGDTIVHESVKKGSQSDVIIILKILAKLNLTNLLSQANNLRQTPLHIACIFDKHAFVRPLLGLTCDPNAQDINGNTALHIAVAENLKQCVESFVSTISTGKLNVNLTNDDGLTPLHLAIRNGNIDFVKILLVKCNASAKIANSRDGNNALHLAVQQSNTEIVKVILENCNVNVNITNRAGLTALDLAKTLEAKVRKEIIDLLNAFLPPSTLSPTTDFIKEEPDFDESSCSTGDDDDKSSQMSLEIKENDIKLLLKNEKICHLLACLLNEEDKWKKLSKLLKLDHMLFMWSNAEDMLRHVIAVDDITPISLINALQAIDQHAVNMVTSLLKTS